MSAQFMLKAGLFAEAETVFKQLIDKDDSSLVMAEGYLESLSKQAKYEEAAKVSETILPLFPDAFWINYFRAEALLALEKIDEAHDLLRLLVSSAPNNNQVFGLALRYLKTANM